MLLLIGSYKTFSIPNLDHVKGLDTPFCSLIDKLVALSTFTGNLLEKLNIYPQCTV